MSALSAILGIPTAAAQPVDAPPPDPPPEDELVRHGEEDVEPLPPLVRLLELRKAWEDLHRIEPDNPALTSLSAPTTAIPEQAALDRLLADTISGLASLSGSTATLMSMSSAANCSKGHGKQAFPFAAGKIGPLR